MFIQTESTPNPATLKFMPGQSVLDLGTADFPTADTASKSPLANRIFAVGDVAGCFWALTSLRLQRLKIPIGTILSPQSWAL